MSKDFVKKTVYNKNIAKISDIEGKYFIDFDYNKFTNGIIDAKIKQKELVNKSNISNFSKNSDLNTKLKALATKAELKAKEYKIVKLQTHDLCYFLGKIFFGDDGFQNMFVYQPKPKLDTLELKEDKVNDYVIG